MSPACVLHVSKQNQTGSASVKVQTLDTTARSTTKFAEVSKLGWIRLLRQELLLLGLELWFSVSSRPSQVFSLLEILLCQNILLGFYNRYHVGPCDFGYAVGIEMFQRFENFVCKRPGLVSVY